MSVPNTCLRAGITMTSSRGSRVQRLQGCVVRLPQLPGGRSSPCCLQETTRHLIAVAAVEPCQPGTLQAPDRVLDLVQVEKQIQRVCHSIMGLDSAPDALRAFIFVTGSYLRGKQETGAASQ